MEFRTLGKTGFEVASVALGCWQIGGCWTSGDETAVHKAALNAYLDAGANLLDTANVYGGDYGTDKFGWSERTIKDVLAERRAAGKDADRRIYVATKAGRAPPGGDDHGPERYTYESLAASAAASAGRLGVETIDLLQLHCPPTDVLRGDSAFEALRRLQAEGKILHWGVSVETVEEATLAIAQPDCGAVQIIFNMLRHKPATSAFLAKAKAANVGTLIRLPFASGLLTGKVTPEYVASLSDGDHRKFNAAGQFFDKGESWSGLGECLEDVAMPAVDGFKAAIDAAKERGEIAVDTPMGQVALRWILDHEGVTCCIPGARTVEQVAGNLGTAGVPKLSDATHAAVKAVYADKVQAIVEPQW